MSIMVQLPLEHHFFETCFDGFVLRKANTFVSLDAVSWRELFVESDFLGGIENFSICFA